MLFRLYIATATAVKTRVLLWHKRYQRLGIFRFLKHSTNLVTVRDNFNLKSHKYVCIITYQPDTNFNPYPNPTTKQHAIVNIQLNIVTWHTYADTIHVVAPYVLL